MPIAYDPKDPFKTILAANIKRTVNTRSYYGTLFMFCMLRVTVSVVMSADEAKKLDTMLTYPMSLVGTLFSFLIGFFMNNCYTRFMDNWRAAMIGWSRMNDLALQVPRNPSFEFELELATNRCSGVPHKRRSRTTKTYRESRRRRPPSPGPVRRSTTAPASELSDARRDTAPASP